MISPTAFYLEMKASLEKASKLVATVNPLECKTDLQHLKLQGYILISHSVFEEYLEKLGRQTARTAKQKFDNEGKITKALLGLISTNVVEKISHKSKNKISTELSTNLEIFAGEAVSAYFSSLTSNHGVTTNDQKNIFLPLGIDLEDLDIGLSQNLHTFGVQRGSVAHSFKLQREDTLSDVKSRLDNIVRDLEALDREACQVCNI
jgi:hypothetical protein